MPESYRNCMDDCEDAKVDCMEKFDNTSPAACNLIYRDCVAT